MSVDDESQYSSHTATATAAARSDRSRLVPFVGAGASRALGLPGWQELISAICSGTDVATDSSFEQPQVLQDAREALGQAPFASRVQSVLSLAPDCSSLALLALTRTGVRRIVTTNLDHAIENSYAFAGRPIPPSQVVVGSTADDLRVTLPPTRSIQLFKIHGSLERPATWVLTQDQYDQAYVGSGALEEFISREIDIPLFIGCSLTDPDVKRCLRIAAVNQKKRGYAILPISAARDQHRECRRRGISPIYFHNFDQIAEILDDIFELESLEVLSVERRQESSKFTLVSGVRVTVDGQHGSSVENPGTFTARLVANAVEGRPRNSIVDESYRREHGLKGLWRTQLQELLKDATRHDNDADFDLFSRICAILSQIPELVIGSLLPSLFAVDDIDAYRSINALLSATRESELHERTLCYLLDQLRNEELSLNTLRAIAKLLGKEERHPAQRVPPDAITVGGITATTYPLTRYQVGILRDDDELRTSNPMRAYTLSSASEVPQITDGLSEITGHNWRVPTSGEWLLLCGRRSAADVAWPWGPAQPERDIHAHLDFRRHGGPRSKQPLEVGLFPRGLSREGLHDLVGNVYEVCDHREHEGFALAGGAWTTDYRDEGANSFRWITRWGTGSGNVGLRPVHTAAVDDLESTDG